MYMTECIPLKKFETTSLGLITRLDVSSRIVIGNKAVFALVYSKH